MKKEKKEVLKAGWAKRLEELNHPSSQEARDYGITTEVQPSAGKRKPAGWGAK
jgi:hypothetical protein